MEIKVDSNAGSVSNWIRHLNRDQFPFAVSLAINRTAFEVRDTQRRGVEKRFTIRRTWVTRGIQVSQKATKREPEAIVRLVPDRAFLTRFEEGGVVRPERSSAFAVPDEARTTKTGVLRKSDRPRSFNFRLAGEGSVARVYKGDQRTFMIRMKGQEFDDVSGIFQRRGRRRGVKWQGWDSNVRRLFHFTEEAKLPDDLRFEVTAEETFLAEIDREVDDAFDWALKTAR